MITKRNIFYQNTELFKHQRLVDSLVDDLAFTLGFGREDLNIVRIALFTDLRRADPEARLLLQRGSSLAPFT